MIYGFLTFTTVTKIDDTSWSCVGKLSMSSGASTTSLEQGITIFIKGTNANGNTTYKRFKVQRTTYVRGKLTVYIQYSEEFTDVSEIYEPTLENNIAIITSRGTDEGFYFLPTTELSSDIPQSDLDYIRNLDLQERDVNYDRKMQEINSAQDVIMQENKSGIAKNSVNIDLLKNEDENIYRILSLIQDAGRFDDLESDES